MMEENKLLQIKTKLVKQKSNFNCGGEKLLYFLKLKDVPLPPHWASFYKKYMIFL